MTKQYITTVKVVKIASFVKKNIFVQLGFSS